MITSDLMVTAFQPYAATDATPTAWTQWDCGTEALCLQWSGNYGKTLVIKRHPGSPLTVTLPDGTQRAVNQDIVGFAQAMGQTFTHEVSK
jgi:hypothetical protein